MRPVSSVDVEYLIKALLKYNASDLHLKADRPPLFRVDGKLIAAKMPVLVQSQVESMISSLLTAEQVSELAKTKNIDFSFRIDSLGRFRCSVYYTRGALSAAIRMIPVHVPRLDDLGVPSVLKDFCQRNRGLIMVTGAAGSGKSTTLAAMVRHINETRNAHILTIEDPIEFIHTDMKSCVSQREVGSDISTVDSGLLAGLRQDPDVIVIGEMRDSRAIQAALTAAESGLLVITTLHTKDAKGSITRILDVLKGDLQNQVRIQLASALLAVVSQQLIVRKGGIGRVLACEVMVKSPVIENYILSNEIDKIQDAIADSNTYYKMQTMNQSLEKMVKAQVISFEAALGSSPNPEELRLKLTGVQEGFEQATKLIERR